jgi:hypothetical protein
VKNLFVFASVLMLLINACSPKPQPEAAIDEPAIRAEIESLMAEIPSVQKR